MALTVTQNQSPAPSATRLLGMTSGRWSHPALDGNENLVRCLEPAEIPPGYRAGVSPVPQDAQGLLRALSRHISVLRGGNHPTNLHLARLKLICPPYFKASEYITYVMLNYICNLKPLIDSWGTLALPHHSKQSQLCHMGDLRYLIFTQLSQPIFKPSYLQAGYWYKTH